MARGILRPTLAILLGFASCPTVAQAQTSTAQTSPPGSLPLESERCFDSVDGNFRARLIPPRKEPILAEWESGGRARRKKETPSFRYFPNQHGTVEILFPNTTLKLEIGFTSGFGVYSVYGKLPGVDDGQEVIPPAAFGSVGRAMGPVQRPSNQLVSELYFMNDERNVQYVTFPQLGRELHYKRNAGLWDDELPPTGLWKSVPCQHRDGAAMAAERDPPPKGLPARAILYEENSAAPHLPKTTQARAVWRLDNVNTGQGKPLETVVRARRRGERQLDRVRGVKRRLVAAAQTTGGVSPGGGSRSAAIAAPSRS